MRGEYLTMFLVILLMFLASMHILAITMIIFRVDGKLVVGSLMDYIFYSLGQGAVPYKLLFATSIVVSVLFIATALIHEKVYGGEPLPRDIYIILIVMIVVDIILMQIY